MPSMAAPLARTVIAVVAWGPSPTSLAKRGVGPATKIAPNGCAAASRIGLVTVTLARA
jgi:hypothetical protein